MPRPLGYKRRDAKKLEARRFAAVARLQRGESIAEVARSLGVCKQSVQRWAAWYRLRGEKGCARRPKTGAPVRNWLTTNWRNSPACWSRDRQPMDSTRPSGPPNASPV